MSHGNKSMEIPRNVHWIHGNPVEKSPMENPIDHRQFQFFSRAWDNSPGVGWEAKSATSARAYLVVIITGNSTDWWYTYPSEKYEFVTWDDDIPNWMEK